MGRATTTSHLAVVAYDDLVIERVFMSVALFAAGLPAVSAQTAEAEERSIRMLINTFAQARNSHNGQTVAGLYSEDGEWISSTGRSVRGRSALAKLWGDLPGQVQRTVESVNFAGPNIAVVRVLTEYPDPIGRHHETFVFVKTGGAWAIRVHQSLD